jgi:hypothetical protein
MRWIIKVTHQDDTALSTTCEYIIEEELLNVVPSDFRTYIFEKMVKQVEDKLKEKNV